MRLLIILFVTILVSCSSEPKINFSGDLEIGVEISDSLNQNDTDSYQLHLDANTFIYGFADQKTVDVVVELKDGENNLIDVFDGPAEGPENFFFEVEEAGEYSLEVSAFEEDSGQYSIVIQIAEPISPDPADRVDQLMTAFSGDVPGAVIGVMQDGQMIYSKAYGKANLTHDLAFDLNMPTNIGSVSKQFTATAILLLEQQGKLSLEDDVLKHLPELPDLGEVVTVKNLLNHTNGWREVYNLAPLRGWNFGDRLLKDEVMTILQRQKELQASPGEEFNYNNSAFIMAAEIVERLTDQTFPEFVKENIFEPLEMTNSYVRDNPSEIIPRATQGYYLNEGAYQEVRDLDAAYGAGAIYTTADDLVKWMNNFETAEVGGTDLVEKLVTPGILNNGDTLDYGLGIGVNKYKGLKRYLHGGADIAHRAMLTYFPEIRSGVILLSNNSNFNPPADKFVDIFFKDHFKEEEEGNNDEQADGFTVSEETLDQYTGKFKITAIGLVIEYKVEDGVLVAYPTGQPSLKMEATAEDAFDYIGVEASVVFSQDEQGEYNSALHSQGGAELELVRFPPFEPSIEQLEAYMGRYFCEELESFYTITVKDSTLNASQRNMEDIELSPNEEDSFGSNSFFVNEMTFVRDATGKVSGFTISNGRTKGILFERQ